MKSPFRSLRKLLTSIFLIAFFAGCASPRNSAISARAERAKALFGTRATYCSVPRKADGRADVDRHRIAFVGHSWDAHVGAILAGIETRMCCYVLMASGYSDEEETFASTNPDTIAHIKEAGVENVREYFHEYAWDDPVYFLGHTDRESIFLQFATGDHISGGNAQQDKALGQKYLDAFSSKDKKMEFYSAGHALNAAARLDRVRWLQKHLGLKKVDEQALGEIPQLK